MVLLLIHLVETEGAPHEGIKHNLDISFTEIMDTQSMIGWDVVKYGFLSVEWKKTQHSWVSQRYPNYSLHESDWWLKRVEEALWNYVTDIWEHRNRLDHGKTKGDLKQKKITELRQQVRNILDHLQY